MFDFLEVDESEYRNKAQHQVINVEIPDNQRLVISDLETINPNKEVLKLISKKILDKYCIVPLFILIPGTKPFLPKQLKTEFHGKIDGEKNLTLFVGCKDPFDNQILNILRNITRYSVVAIPIKESDARIFLKKNYSITLNNNIQKEINKTKNSQRGFKYDNIYFWVKENFIYIIIFSLLISGLIGLKLLIN